MKFLYFSGRQHVFYTTWARPGLSHPLHTKLRAWAVIFLMPVWVPPHNAKKYKVAEKRMPFAMTVCPVVFIR
jgi:hypothetical protein